LKPKTKIIFFVKNKLIGDGNPSNTGYELKKAIETLKFTVMDKYTESLEDLLSMF